AGFGVEGSSRRVPATRSGGLKAASLAFGSGTGPLCSPQRTSRRSSAMRGYVDDIERVTKENGDFRRVLYTGHNLQLVVMSLNPGEEIGAEVHDDRDQFFRIEAGDGMISIDRVDNAVKAEDAVIVARGARHNVKASGTTSLKIYTIYG